MSGGQGPFDIGGEDEDQDDDSTESQSWTFDAVFADLDARSRHVLVEWFAAAIRHAHDQSPSCWAVTRRNGPRLRLLVGHTVAFEIGRGRVGVGLHLPSIADSARRDADADRPDFPFARIDGGVVRWFSVARFLELAATIRASAFWFIELAAAGYPRTPFARYHAPAMLAALSEAVGSTLPTPVVDAPSYWKISPGEHAKLWPQCRDGGYITIGWSELGDLSGVDREAFDDRFEGLRGRYPTLTSHKLEQVWRFRNIPAGAKVVANDGKSRVVGIGTVMGPYRFVDDGKEYAHRLPVVWEDVRERAVTQPGWAKTIIQLSPEKFAEIVNAPFAGENRPEPPRPEAKPAERIDFDGIMDRLEAAGLQFPEELVASYLLALQAKRFVILSGISGTGKTQLALAVAKVFQPSGAVAEPQPSAQVDPAGGYRIRVQPYMLKFRRLVVPAVLAGSIRGNEISGRVTVRFGDGQSESLKYSAQSTATQLLFKGSMREWFDKTFDVGDQLELSIEGEDPPVLCMAPVAALPEVAVNRPATYRVVAVRPDWTDNHGLLGYYNPITREYQITPFLRLLLAATEEETRAVRDGGPRLPYFVVLDEMNLARVEHYFSEFLSCLESGEPLHLHSDPSVAEGASETGEAVPMQLSIPRNLFFTGTVNVDETTYMFSPKVLDRAFVLEFNDVDLDQLGTPTDDDVSGLRLKHFAGALDIRDKPSSDDYKLFRELADGALHRALSSLNQRLQAGHRHFGYRVANEIGRFIGLAAEQAGKDVAGLWEALDVAVVAKVLPKLHGTQQEIEDVLGRLLAFAVDVESSLDARGHESDWKYIHARLVPTPGKGAGSPKLPRAAAKLWRMLQRVRQQGYVSFIE